MGNPITPGEILQKAGWRSGKNSPVASARLRRRTLGPDPLAGHGLGKISFTQESMRGGIFLTAVQNFLAASGCPERTQAAFPPLNSMSK